MTEMQEDNPLGKSVAAVLKDDESVAGTTFLFHRDQQSYLWFTCHHVIADLNRLWIGFNFQDRQHPTKIEAAYIPEWSNPHKDIAVLRTQAEPSLEHFSPLPLGAVPQLNPASPHPVAGFGFTPSNIRNFFDGESFYASLTMGQPVTFNIHSTPEAAQQVTRFNNPWNIVIQQATNYVYKLSSSEVSIEGGLSGSPICFFTDHNRPLCVGMLNQARKNGPQPGNKSYSGTAISYYDLFSSAGAAIPFHPYTDCVIIVIAATRREMEEHQKNFPDMNIYSNICSYYHEHDRHRWQSFNEEADSIDVILKSLQLRHTFQFASVYLDNSEELENYLRSSAGPTMFIVDCCSVDIPALKPLVNKADSLYSQAVYLFPFCEARFIDLDRPRLRSQRRNSMPMLHTQRAERFEECSTIDQFKRRAWQLLEQIVGEYVFMLQSTPNLERLQRIGIRPINRSIHQPTLNPARKENSD